MDGVFDAGHVAFEKRVVLAINGPHANIAGRIIHADLGIVDRAGEPIERIPNNPGINFDLRPIPGGDANGAFIRVERKTSGGFEGDGLLEFLDILSGGDRGKQRDGSGNYWQTHDVQYAIPAVKVPPAIHT